MTPAVRALVEAASEAMSYLGNVAGNCTLAVKLVDANNAVRVEDEHRRNVVEVEIPQGETCEGCAFEPNDTWNYRCGMKSCPYSETYIERGNGMTRPVRFYRNKWCRAKYGYTGKEEGA